MLIYQRVQEKKNIFWFQGRLWHQVVCKVWSGSSTRGNPRNPPNSAQNLGSLSEVHWWSNDFRHVYSTRIADWVHVRSFWDQSFSFTHVNKWIYTYIYIYTTIIYLLIYIVVWQDGIRWKPQLTWRPFAERLSADPIQHASHHPIEFGKVGWLAT